MKRVFSLVLIALCAWLSVPTSAMADETVTVTANSSDISENLNLKTVATLFGQAENLEQFEQMLNNPDSAFSNLDLNGDGDVDYLRVVETADGNRHLVVIQAVLAKDIYQDVASIFVEKDDDSDAITVQVVGDEYLYGENYIIEPVYIYRPLIYDWFWGPSWVAWHSPYYWGYWPGWWRPYHCIAHHLYWDHCYWFHHYHPICSYRTAHHYRPHYLPMREPVRRNDFATRHPERSFATRNATRNVVNAHALDVQRRAASRNAAAVRTAGNASRSTATRVNTGRTSDNTFGSNAVRTSSATRSRVSGNATAPTRSTTTITRTSARTTTTIRTSATTPTRTSATTPTRTSVTTPVRSTTTRSAATPSRSSSTSVRSAATPSRSSSTSVRSAATPSRSSSTSVRSAATPSRSSSTSVRSVSTPSRSSSAGYSSGASRSAGSSSSRSGGSRTR